MPFGSQYPKHRDTFSALVDLIDIAVVEDLASIYDTLIAIEQEVGLNPAGELGSLRCAVQGVA